MGDERGDTYAMLMDSYRSNMQDLVRSVNA